MKMHACRRTQHAGRIRNHTGRGAGARLLALAAAGWLTAGCGGAGAGTRVRMSPVERPDLGPGQAEQGRLVLPDDTDFVYRRFSSGQEGDSARGEAEAIAADGARCRAEVNGRGSAWGAFQLGHCFDNLTGKTLDAVVTVRLTADWSTPGGAVRGTPRGTGSLTFFMQDTQSIELRRETLVSSSLGKGSQSSMPRHEFVFDARLEPGLGYYLILAGRVEVESEEGQSAAVALNVTDLSLEISWQAAETGARARGAGGVAAAPGSVDAGSLSD